MVCVEYRKNKHLIDKVEGTWEYPRKKNLMGYLSDKGRQKNNLKIICLRNKKKEGPIKFLPFFYNRKKQRGRLA